VYGWIETGDFVAMNSMGTSAAATFDSLAKGELTPDQQRKLAADLLEDDGYFIVFFAVVEKKSAASGGGASCAQARAHLALTS
jgi:hypothetical protein